MFALINLTLPNASSTIQHIIALGAKFPQLKEVLLTLQQQTALVPIQFSMLSSLKGYVKQGRQRAKISTMKVAQLNSIPKKEKQ